ncbi:Ribulose-phosphate 3 epimerase family-domain-containing protein, partial [Baffinella frigidus]
QEAADVDVGSDGLVALETFQGSRTPITDPLAKGALVGLSLSHTRAHVWRALLEAVCFGTRACVDALRQAGHGADEILVAGGATRSPFWLQMHADATGLPVAVCACPDGPLLGSAILAAAAAGLHGGDVLAAVKAMVRVEKRIQPNPEAVLKYTAVFQHTYSSGSATNRARRRTASGGGRGLSRGGPVGKDRGGPLAEVSLGEGVAVCPSLLGCDWADIAGAVKACEKAGAEMLHLDMFDGVAIPSPNALTFGPQMIAAIRKRTSLLLDVHLVAQNPSRYIEPLAAAGADRLTFQWESVPSTAKATALARAIRDSGMRAGVCLAPEIPVDAILGLVDEGLVDLINILTVKPGFGGQALQSAMLDKVRALSKIKNRLEKAGVDGGVTGSTAKACIDAGATALVSGSWLFAHKGGVAAAVKELRAAA